MRKFLSIVLASLMVFSVVLIFPAAEEYNDYTDILGKKVTTPEYVSAGSANFSATETNIAKEKSYNYTGQYIFNGNELYPDTDNKELTDGIKGSSKSDIGFGVENDLWVGINWHGEGTETNSDEWTKETISKNNVVLDLSEKTDNLTKFALYAQQLSDGIDKPSSVEILISDDNKNFKSVGTANEKMIISAEIENRSDYGIYSYTFTTSEPVSARYIKFYITHGGPWTFVSEVEVYQDTNTVQPPKPTESNSLISFDPESWKSGEATFDGKTETASIDKSGEAIKIYGSENTYPYAYYNIENPVKYELEDYELVYDFTISEEGQANIILFCEGSKVEDGKNYITNITQLIAPDGDERRVPCSNDLLVGTYKGKIKLSDLNLDNVSLLEEGKLTISGVKIFTVYGAVVTINKLAIKPKNTNPEPDENNIDGFVFDIRTVDGLIAGEDGIIVTSEEAIASANLRWAIYVQCEKVSDNIFKAKEDAHIGCPEDTKFSFAKDDIVIGIHSSSSNMDDIKIYPNVAQKKAAMEIKAGMFFTLENIDITKAGEVTNGTATVSFKNPGTPEEPITDKEEIIVDGKLDDTVWTTSDFWYYVDSTFGKWQVPLSEYETRNENYNFLFRTDDNNLYLAFRLNNAPIGTADCCGNGKGSNLRLWVYTDSSYKAYTSFIDFYYIDGNLQVKAKKNINKDGNTRVDLDIPNVVAKSTHGSNFWNIEAAIPFDVIGSDTDAHFYITYSAPLSLEDISTNNALYFGKYGPGTQDEIHADAPYCDWDELADVDITFEDIKLGKLINDYVDMTGEKVTNPSYVFDVSAPETYVPGQTIDATITIKDIKSENGIGFIHLFLYYDKTKVTPVVLNDYNDENDLMESFLVYFPLTKENRTWESLSKLEENICRYDLAFFTTKDYDHAKADGSIVIKVPFKVKPSADGIIAFQVPHKTTYAYDYPLNKLYGNAGLAISERAEGISIDGTVSINGANKYGQILTVDTSNISPSNATLTYQWNRNGEPISGATENKYIITASDIGKDITVTVTGSNGFYGSLTSNDIIPEKAAQQNPATPTVLSKSTDKIVLNKIDGCEYKIEDGKWQDSAEFTSLLPDTSYNFYVRYKETDTHKASLAIVLLGEKTKKSSINLSDSFANGFTDNMTLADVKKALSDNIQIKDSKGNIISGDTLIGTGCVISYNGKNYKVVVKGDVSGNGKIDSKDYLIVKRAFLKTHKLSEVQNEAACLSGKDTPTSKDYLKIKRHFLKSFNLYENN